MNKSCRLAFDGAIPPVLTDSLKSGLFVLWRGFEYARDLNTPTCEFAVDANTLHQAGFSTIDLRWLVASGFIEVVASSDSNQTSFMLTPVGYDLANEVLSKSTLTGASKPARESLQSDHAHNLIDGKTIPKWDHERRELRFCGSLIKRFRWAALNQETILAAYEEEGWPIRIDDPLPQKQNQNPKCRLHDTIKCLNRYHENRVIHFSGDGTGEGVLWRLL
jgi:hypothetical protein